MSTVVITLKGAALQKLIKTFNSQQVASKNPYITFAAKVDKVMISVSTSGKVVFQGEKAEEVAKYFGYQAPDASIQTAPAGQKLALIGSDEVGNGSYFGGLAVVASFVTPDKHALLRKLGVDDSKRLTDANIRKIAPILKQEIPHRALLLSPKKYNQVVGAGKQYNAVSVKVALHNQAIYLLLKDGFKPQKIVIDAFTSQQNYQKYVKQEVNQFDNPLTLEEKAEGEYLAVAVSSIIARDLFLDYLDQLSQKIGYPLPSGAGQKSDFIASQILKTHGMAGLAETAKLHFANTKKAQELLRKGNWGSIMKFLKEWGPFILFVLVLGLSRLFLWQPVKVDGHSMDPTLADGERLIVLDHTKINRFDIVVAKETEDGQTKEIVKRVIGMPGDTITYNDDTLYINGKEVDEKYLDEYKQAFDDDQLQDIYAYNSLFQELAEKADAFTTDSDGNTEFTVKVPKGEYYLMGDDRIVSKDSREVGTFPKSSIVGEVKFRFWPLSKIGFIE